MANLARGGDFQFYVIIFKKLLQRSAFRFFKGVEELLDLCRDLPARRCARVVGGPRRPGVVPGQLLPAGETDGADVGRVAVLEGARGSRRDGRHLGGRGVGRGVLAGGRGEGDVGGGGDNGGGLLAIARVGGSRVGQKQNIV